MMKLINFKALSIVIPVGKNDKAWQSLIKQCAIFGLEVEIILASCQPLTGIPESIVSVISKQGRAIQQNAGANKATRPFLWFVHADTQLTAEVVNQLQQFIENNQLCLGYFQLQFAKDGPKQTVLNAWLANKRSRYLGLPFGDQGFILSAELFKQMQGFDEQVNLGEDLDFVVRLQAQGILLKPLSANLITSARRYQQAGWLKTSLRFIWLTFKLRRQAKQRLEAGL